jgi:hypothetical protein
MSPASHSPEPRVDALPSRRAGLRRTYRTGRRDRRRHDIGCTCERRPADLHRGRGRRRVPGRSPRRARESRRRAARRPERAGTRRRPRRGCFRTMCNTGGSRRSPCRTPCIASAREPRGSPQDSRTDRPASSRARSPCAAALPEDRLQRRAGRWAVSAERCAGRVVGHTPDRTSGGRGCRDHTSSRS